MAKRLWEKGESVDAAVLAFTVGDDPELDQELIVWDCQGSAAQARMLGDIGLLAAEDTARLVTALAALAARGEAGTFTIPRELEDVHSAIEATLVDELGEPGKKIHAGRSRNDQIIVTTRLYLRRATVDLLALLTEFARVTARRFDELESVPMPGYTHMQPAMPSSVGMWLHALVEATLELVRDGVYLVGAMNVNPLGAAAGFGSTLPIDRQRTAELLDFDGVQRSVIDVQNSRGRFALKALRWATDIGSLCEKLACDLMLYSVEDRRFVSIPRAFTTGSSIMPQKHNPDVLELARARASRIRGAATELAGVTAKLPSSYHRDLQYTKAPMLRGLRDAREVLWIMTRVVESLTVHRDALEAAMVPELYATYEAFRHVRDGMSFRDAYRETAARVEAGAIDPTDLARDFEPIRQQTLTAMKAARGELAELERVVAAWEERLEHVAGSIFQV